MFNFSSLGVRAHIWIGTTAIVAILMGAGLYSLYQVKALQTINDKMYRHPMAVSVEFVAEMAVLESEVDAQMDLINERFLGPKDMLTAISTEFEKWPAVQEQIIAVAKKKNRSATQRALNKDLRNWVELIEPTIKAVTDFAESKGISFYENATSSADRAFQWALSFFAAGILFSSIVGIWTIRSVMRPLGAEPVVVQELVAKLAQGDLTVPITVSEKDETSLLRSVSNLRDNLSRFRQTSRLAAKDRCFHGGATSDRGQQF